jgi:hypothetical protein
MTQVSLMMSMVFAYPFYGPWAFLVGVIYAVAAIWLNLSPIATALVLGLLVSVVASLAATLEIGGAITFALPMAVASLVCWGVTRKLEAGMTVGDERKRLYPALGILVFFTILGSVIVTGLATAVVPIVGRSLR